MDLYGLVRLASEDLLKPIKNQLHINESLYNIDLVYEYIQVNRLLLQSEIPLHFIF